MDINWNMIGGITISGLIVVFTALILLIICMIILTKITSACTKFFSDKKEHKKSSPAQTASSSTDRQESSNPIPLSYIAAITAAICYHQDGAVHITEIKPLVESTQSNNAWGFAGKMENTSPFQRSLLS